MGFFKKIFKGIGKVFKKIGKSIKRAFKKGGKWFGKLGVFGQIALSFIPGLGPMLSGLFKGLGQGALRILHEGLTATGLGGKIVKGASWIVDTARLVVGGIQKGFKTVTSGATSFIKNSTKWLGSKIPGVNKLITQAPETFFGTGGDSVLGRVGREVTNNFTDFKDAIGGILKGPKGRAALIEKELAMTKIGGVKVDTREQPFQAPEAATEAGLFSGEGVREAQANTLIKDISTGIQDNLGSAAKNNFDKLIEGQYGNNARDFLKIVQADPGFVNKWINSRPDKVSKWFDFVKTGQGKNPFADMEFPDPNKLAVETDKGFFKSLFPGSSKDDSSLLSKGVKTTGENLRASVTNLPGSLLTSAVTQAAVGTDYSFPTQDPSKGLTQQNQFGYFRFGGGQQLEVSPLASGGSGVDAYAFTPDVNSILGGMFNDGQAQGMYGFPGFDSGLQPQNFLKLQYPQPNYFNVGN